MIKNQCLAVIVILLSLMNSVMANGYKIDDMPADQQSCYYLDHDSLKRACDDKLSFKKDIGTNCCSVLSGRYKVGTFGMIDLQKANHYKHISCMEFDSYRSADDCRELAKMHKGDEEKELMYNKRACKLGRAYHCTYAADTYHKNNNKELAKEYYTQALEYDEKACLKNTSAGSYANACYRASKAYGNNEYIKQDLKKAELYRKRECSKGSYFACEGPLEKVKTLFFIGGVTAAYMGSLLFN